MTAPSTWSASAMALLKSKNVNSRVPTRAGMKGDKLYEANADRRHEDGEGGSIGRAEDMSFATSAASRGGK